MPYDRSMSLTRFVLPATSLAVRETLSHLFDRPDGLVLPAGLRDKAQIVLAEVLNNIVEHAYQGDPDGEIQLWWTLGPSGLHVRIADSGRAMPDGKLPLALERRAADHAALVPEGGFGWFLIAGLAHNIVYRRERGMNVLTFRMVVSGRDSAHD